MDDERKVNPAEGEGERALEGIERSKAWFLRAALEEYRSAQAQYSLNDEFAKTRKNRSLVVVLAVAGTCLAFGLFAFFFNGYLETKNNTVQVNTKEFEDINLRELLDKAKKLESDLEYSQTNLAKLENEQLLAGDRVRSESADRLTMFRSTNPGEAGLEAENAAEARRLASAIAGVEADFTARKQPVNEWIALLQSQLAAIDARKLEVARKQEVILNNERKVYDVERQRVQSLLQDQLRQTVADYEGRLKQRERFTQDLEASAHATLVKEQERLKLLYNPLWTEESAVRLLTSPQDQNRQGAWVAQIPDTYREVVSQARLAALNQELAEYRGVMGLLGQVPWANSMPLALAQLQSRALALTDAAVAIFDDFWKVVRSREATIREREVTIRERETTIAEREATIREREAVIAQRDATIQEREREIANRDETIKARQDEVLGLRGDLQARDAAIAAAGGRYQDLLASFDRAARANRLDGVVVDPGTGVLVAWLRPDGAPAVGKRYYALHGANEVLGEYELTETGALSQLKPAAGPLPPAAGQKAPARPAFSGKAALTMDWLVAVEGWAAWKAAAAKAPAR
jgi:hypothetical protein